MTDDALAALRVAVPLDSRAFFSAPIFLEKFFCFFWV